MWWGMWCIYYRLNFIGRKKMGLLWAWFSTRGSGIITYPQANKEEMKESKVLYNSSYTEGMYYIIHCVTFFRDYPNSETIGTSTFHNLPNKTKLLFNVIQYEYARYTMIYIG